MVGSVLRESNGNYYVQIYCRAPGRSKKDRHRLRVSSRESGDDFLDRIRARVDAGEPLHVVLQAFGVADKSVGTFKARWLDFCDDKQTEVQSGRLSAYRVYELRRYVERGYFDFFDKIPFGKIDYNLLFQWVRMMRKRKTKRSGTMSDKTIKNVLFDVRQWSCLSFVDTFRLWKEGVHDAEESTSLLAGAAA